MAPRRDRGDDPGADDAGASPDPTPPPPAGADRSAGGDEAVDPGPAPDDPGEGEGPAEERRRPVPVRRLIDGRTIAVCTLVALIAALATGLAVSRLTDDGGGEPAAGDGELVQAREAPDATFERFDGTEASLADYRGQPLVVNFWGSWCAPCVQEMPELQRVHTSLGDQVAFLGVNIDDTPEAAIAMAERTGVTYDLARDPDGGLARDVDLANLPVTLLILPDGTVVDTIYARLSAERLCEKINQSLLAGALTACG